MLLIVQIVLLAIAIVGFVTWFWKARRLTGDKSPEGAAADAALRKQLNKIMIGSFAAVVVALLLSVL